MDDDVWQLDIQPGLEAPSEPVSLHDFLGRSEWRDALESGAALLRS